MQKTCLRVTFVSGEFLLLAGVDKMHKPPGRVRRFSSPRVSLLTIDDSCAISPHNRPRGLLGFAGMFIHAPVRAPA
jgi:hypothetical protein